MSNVACQIVQFAQRLRAEDLERYGTKGSTKGSPGYAPRGWREAVRAATQSYYQSSGKTPSQATIKRRELGTIPQQLKDQGKPKTETSSNHSQLYADKDKEPSSKADNCRATNKDKSSRRATDKHSSRKSKKERRSASTSSQQNETNSLPHRQAQAFSFSTPSPMRLDEMSLPSVLVEFGTQS